MSGVIIYLVLMLPPGSSDLPESRRATVCFLFGLASDGVYTAFSVTRQAVVSYTAFSPLPLRAVIFCCTFLGVTSTGRYPASCPMKPGLSSPAVFRHLQPRSPVLHIYLIYQAFFQKSSPFTNFNKRNIKCFLKDDRSIDGFYLQYYLNNVKSDLKPQMHSVDTV